MRVEFICERCGLESHVDIANDESVYAGCEAIRANHARWSPECTGDLSTIRLPHIAISEQAATSPVNQEGE